MRKRALFLAAICLGFFASGSAGAAVGDALSSIETDVSNPAGIAWDGSDLWIADWEHGKICKLEGRRGRIREAYDAPGRHPSGIVFVSGRLYVCDAWQGRIRRYDPESGRTDLTIDSPGPAPTDLAFDGRYLWIADSREDKLYQVNPEDGAIANYLGAPSGNVTGIAFAMGYLWVGDRMKDAIYMCSPENGEVIMYVPAPGKYVWGTAFDGVSLWVGDFQSGKLFQLDLQSRAPFALDDTQEVLLTYRHRLENIGAGRVTNASVYLALAPDSLPNQKLLGAFQFTPQPSRIAVDEHGQRFACFEGIELGPGAAFEASYTIAARTAELRYCIFPERVGSEKDIPDRIRKLYLRPRSRYMLDDPTLREAAASVAGEETNLYWRARKLYDWVLNKLEYERVGGWDLPPTLLKRGTGSCSEYTILYISLCRIAGVPARYAGSISMRGDDVSIDNVFHRWAEVYLPNYGWVPVDPSRGDRETAAERGRGFGTLSKRVFVTTHGDGDSEYLGWGYDSGSSYEYSGKGSVQEEAYGLWKLPEEKE